MHKIKSFNEPIQNKPTLVLTPHIGNWEVLCFVLAQLAPLTTMYKPLKNQIMERHFRAFRERSGACFVLTNTSGVKTMLSTLKRGGMTLLLPDQVPELTSGVYAPFFAYQALTMTLAHKLALKSGANVVMAAVIQEKSGFNIEFKELPEAFFSQDATVSAGALNQTIEYFVRQYPEQYQLEYKRYKFGPNFETQDLYANLADDFNSIKYQDRA